GARRGAEQARDGSVGRRNDLRAELQLAALHDLGAPAGLDELPVVALGRGHELAQALDLLRTALQQLAHEVAHEAEDRRADLEHRADVRQTHLLDDVDPASLLEELGAERRERAEHERSLAVDAAGVEVRSGHGRRTHGGLRVDLRLVLRDELRVGRLEELPADREDAVALDLGNPGALQELDGPAARAD